MVRRTVEEGQHEARAAQIVGTLAFFREWSLADVRVALARFEGLSHALSDGRRGDDAEAGPVAVEDRAEVLARQLKWADFFEAMHDTERAAAPLHVVLQSAPSLSVSLPGVVGSLGTVLVRS